MHLTKTLRIFLCYLVVISVGVVFLGQSPVWAKDNSKISTLAGVVSKALVNRALAAQKVNKPKTPKIATAMGVISAAVAAKAPKGSKIGALTGVVAAQFKAQRAPKMGTGTAIAGTLNGLKK